jgi:hypothetical protein
MDAYYFADDAAHPTTSNLKRYARLEVPTGLYLILAKAHFAVSMGTAVPPATDASLAGGALLRMTAGLVHDEAYATVHGSWDINNNHATVNLMAAGEVEGYVDLEAIGLGSRRPSISRLRITALPLDALHLTGTGRKARRDKADFLTRVSEAGMVGGG